MHALLDSFISSIRPFIHLIHCIRSFSSIHICQLTSFHLTNNSYKQTGSYSHVLFLKLPTRRVPGTTWYEFIWILFSRQPHSKNCSQLGLFMIEWPGFGYFRPSARPILMFQRTKVRYGSTFFWQTYVFLHIVSIHFGAAPVWPSQPWPLAPELANLPKWHKMSRSGLEITGMTDAKTDGGGCGYVIKPALQYVTIVSG